MSTVSRTLTPDEKREKLYRRNYWSLMAESFFFSFAMTVFSYSSVLPAYVANITDNALLLSLIPVIYYGLYYGCCILSCAVGVNAKSPKWTSVFICLSQRLGFFLIYISTFAITKSADMALLVFYISFVVCSMASGISTPLFHQLISTVIPRNAGSFFGTYSVIGSVAGLLASQLLRILQENAGFPLDYRMTFLMGLMGGVAATLVVAFGVKEVLDDRVPENIRVRELPAIFKDILSENRAFRRFVGVRVVTAAAEFTVPFYIVKAASLEGVPAGYVGAMTTVLLLGGIVASKVMGYIGDRSGPMTMLTVSCGFGVAAALLALVMPDYRWGYLLFVLVAFVEKGANITNNFANIHYAKGKRTPIYAAISGAIVAPMYICASFVGGVVSTRFSLNAVFVIAAVMYVVAVVCSRFSRRAEIAEAE